MKVITLNQKALSENSLALMSKVDFKPDLIVGIRNGGGVVVEIIEKSKKHSHSHFEYVQLKRDSTLKAFIFTSYILKWLPYKLTNWFRIKESKKVKQTIKTISEDKLTSIEIDLGKFSCLNNDIENILIIDDAIDSGKTMFIVKNNISKLFPLANIKTATISWTIESSIIKPDYYNFKNTLVRFPWSMDYKKNNE